MEALLSVLNNELADGRTQLSAAGHDIEAAASFFKDNYTNSPKETNLENTMALATQSLGTVAYHINKLANNFFEAIEMQSNMVADISDRIEKLRMVTNIHQEKVARKSIGSCSTQKLPIIFHHDQIAPEPPQKYIRRPIDYSILDSVGHGVHTQDLSPNQYDDGTMVRDGMHAMSIRQHNSVSGRSTISNYNSNYSATFYTDARFQNQDKSQPDFDSTMGRTAGIYRSTVVPPPHLMTPVVGASNPGSRPLSPGCYARTEDVLPNPSSTALNVPHPPALRSNDSSSVGSGSAYHGTQHYMVNQTKNNIYSQQQQQQHIPPVQMQFKQQQQQQQQQQPFPSSTQMTTTQPNLGVLNYAQPHNQQQLPFTQQQQQSVPIRQPGFVQQQEGTNNKGYMDAQQQLLNEPSMAQPAAVQPSDAVDQMTLPPPEAYAGTTYTQQYNSASAGLPTVSAAIGNDRRATDGPIQHQPNDPIWIPEFYLEKVVTLYDYEQTREDELSFCEDQIIYVVKKNDDDWWEGVMDGITGLFPGNYVERID